MADEDRKNKPKIELRRIDRRIKKKAKDKDDAKDDEAKAKKEEDDTAKVNVSPPSGQETIVTTIGSGSKEEADSDDKTKGEASGDDKPAASGNGATGDEINPEEAHVLVVEDNVPNFVLIARLLAYMGIQRCEWKTSGWQVVEFADTLPRIDLILMDIRLPYEDGFQALQKVRSHPRLQDTLVIAVTAEASAEQMEKAKKAGFDGFLGKPLDPDRFPEQIRRVLKGESVWEMH